MRTDFKDKGDNKMKKYIFAFVCVCLLTGCGQTEEVPVSESKLEIVHSETITEETTDSANPESTSLSAQTTVSTSSSSSVSSTATTKKVAQANAAAPKVQQTKQNTSEAPEQVQQTEKPDETQQTPTEAVPAQQTAQTTEPAQQLPVDVSVSADNLNPEISARITDSGVEIVRNEQVIQKISADTNALKANKSQGMPCAIVFRDYDFDGYADVFIPESIGTMNSTGRYFRYNAEKKIFERWDDMNSVSFLAQTDTANNTVVVDTRSSAVDHETKTYVWKDGVLTLIDRKIMYQGGDGAIYNDAFEYNDGVETLYKRQRDVYDENNVLVSSEEVNIEPIEQTTSEQGE